MRVSLKTQKKKGGDNINTDKLKGAIFVHGKNISGTAEALKMSKSAFYRRLYGKVEFDREEMNQLSNFLGLSDAEVLAIFFGKEVS